MSLSKVSHLPLAAFLATLITIGMPALARLHPKPADDPWLKLRPPLHPVAGRLTCDGRPVVGACVTFVSQIREEGREYMAVSSTDQDGRFWLRTFSSQGDGAVAGTHFIKVEKMVPTGRMLACSGIESTLDLGAMSLWSASGSGTAVGDGSNIPGAEPPALPHVPGASADGMHDPMLGYCGFPGMPEMVNILPSRFADENTSGLTAQVTADGENEFLIELISEPPDFDEQTPARRAEAAAPRESAS